MKKQLLKQTQLFPDVKQNCMSTAFAHIFQGGYSSGYYSYKWAEVLDADAFEYFKENDLFDPKIASELSKTHILSKGGTQDPLELYVKFRGQKPKVRSLTKAFWPFELSNLTNVKITARIGTASTQKEV